MPRLAPALVLAAGVLLPGIAAACRCPATPPAPSAAYRRADFVVVARVADVKQDADHNGYTVSLNVSLGWKKKVPREISVSTRTTCAFPFTAGEEYLLYLFSKPGGGYSTSKCVGDQPSAGAGKALDWLKAHAAAADPE